MIDREPVFGEEVELPTVSIDLTTTLDDIPEGHSCYLCGSHTNKTFIAHKTNGKSVQTLAEMTPGYQCSNEEECGIATYSVEGLVESLGKARDVYQHYGDLPTAAAMQAAIDHQRPYLEQQNSDQPKVPQPQIQ